MDRMAEEGFHLQRFNNGQAAKRTEIYTNLSAEWWSTIGQLIEPRAVIIPNDEKLVAQLTSRRKQTIARAARSSNQRLTFEPAVSSRQTALMQ
jgi:hypothetical protein